MTVIASIQVGSGDPQVLIHDGVTDNALQYTRVLTLEAICPCPQSGEDESS